MAVRWLPGPEASPPRVAFAVSRKVGSAVSRNRVRRQLWHHLHDRVRVGPGLEPGAYLVSIRPGSSSAELRADLDRALAGLQPWARWPAASTA